MNSKSILEMIGGEKHINPHYNIKVEKMTKEEKKDEMKNRISMALKDPTLQQGFEIICKENAELKKRLVSARAEFQRQYTDKQYWEQKANRLTTEWGETLDQLTKAKDIIKNLLIMKRHPGDTDIDWRVEVTEQAEQFLKEIEK